jgi:hypothetical protein
LSRSGAPSALDLIGFATYLHRVRAIASASVRNYLSGVRSLCVDAGHSIAAFTDPTLVRLLVGMRKIEKDEGRASNPRGPRLPITAWVLEKMIKALSSSTKDKMLGAAWSAGMYGLMRGGEMTVKGSPSSRRYRLLRRDDVIWHDDFVEIKLRASKTDYLRQGVTITLWRNDSSTCPYFLLRNAWDAAISQEPSAALFQDGRGKPLAYSALLRSIKTATRALGVDYKRYGCHSLRAGGATTLALLGYPDSTIKILGRWKSVAYQRYVRLGPKAFRSVSSDMASQANYNTPFGGLASSSATLQALREIDFSFRLSA